MNLNQLANEYLQAQANEDSAFQAIEGTGTDEQWDAYFDAQEGARIALERMLDATREIAFRMVKDKDSRDNLTSFFRIAIHRDGDVRKRAVEKAFELAMLT